ncbi:hypothetical protein HNR23_005013 [Nocardiopsis mwathae]|uniref:Uncharacterized protein n=1 Tax=Nocardiopsis mwathae TaxID=1472723 RepID=A0A7W9YML4_9ACTN|nr:hypothetical protein [Nocardiopsis mwathae]MBB6174953.1 hypothetical protein [Nocardiopsis mwathae]
MSTFFIDGFTPKSHTLIIEPAGAYPQRENWSYELFSGDQLIFSGTDVGSPIGAREDEVAAATLGFLTVRPGDTDDEYFSAYTPEQIEWCNDHAEYLACCLFDENGNCVTDLSAYRIDP